MMINEDYDVEPALPESSELLMKDKDRQKRLAHAYCAAANQAATQNVLIGLGLTYQALTIPTDTGNTFIDVKFYCNDAFFELASQRMEGIAFIQRDMIELVTNIPQSLTVLNLLNPMPVSQSGTWNIATLTGITNTVTTSGIMTDVTKTATIESVQATASGNTTVHTTTNGKSLRLKQFFMFNSGTASITVSLKDSTGGTARYQATLAANTGFGFNLIGCNWQLAQNNNLVASLSAIGTVDVTILGEEV